MIFIDVRTKEEWDEGHIEGAIHLPVESIMDGVLPDLPKDTEISLYCRSGGRAGRAKKILENAGFSNVKNAGGLSDLV